MLKKRHLVVQHLEEVSWKVMEEYPEIVRELIRRKPGIYALYRRDNLYYVGLASNLMGRLKTHLRDRHKGAWDRFSVYLTGTGDHVKELESLVLRIVDPDGNRVVGKLPSSVNLLPEINTLVREQHSDQRAELLGGAVARRRQQSKGRKAKGKGALKGLVERRLTLRAWKGGYEYRASLRRDGTIRYGRRSFDSPNAAATAALRRPAGGWNFWKYRDSSGDWVPLRTLKG